MCRLLGIICKKDIDATWLRQFKTLAKVGKTKDGTGHHDGWGVVVYQENTPTYLGREPVDAINDPKYDIAVNALSSGALRTKCLVAHVRKASPGMEITIKNTHPFIYKNWTFSHNGTIVGFNPTLQLPMDGTTDSETLFKYMLPSLLANLEKPYEGRIKDSLHDAISLMKSYRAINFILTNGQHIFACRYFNESEVSADLITLKYCTIDDTVAVCSEPLTVHVAEKEWEDLKNRQMLIVDDDLRLKIIDL